MYLTLYGRHDRCIIMKLALNVKATLLNEQKCNEMRRLMNKMRRLIDLLTNVSCFSRHRGVAPSRTLLKLLCKLNSTVLNAIILLQKLIRKAFPVLLIK